MMESIRLTDRQRPNIGKTELVTPCCHTSPLIETWASICSSSLHPCRIQQLPNNNSKFSSCHLLEAWTALVGIHITNDLAHLYVSTPRIFVRTRLALTRMSSLFYIYIYLQTAWCNISLGLDWDIGGVLAV